MGGGIAVIIAAILSIFFRLFNFGISQNSITTSVGIAMVSLGLHTFSDYGRQKRRLKIYA